jgi:type IV pilus assembly protein PilB
MDIGFTEEESKEVVCYKGRGCDLCGGTGYKGRIALYEVMPITERIKEHILEGSSAAEIKKAMLADGCKSLRGSGLNKIKMGVSSVEEILRVTFGDQ